MFEQLSKRLTNWLIKKNAVDFEDTEIYQHGINRIFNIVLLYITSAVLGAIFNQLYQSVLFLVSLIMLRSFSGGYHASSSIKCYFLTFITVTSYLLVNNYVSLNRFIWLVLLIMFGIIIFLLSPIGTCNKPLDDIERIIYKKKTIIVWCLEFSIALIFIVLNFPDAYISIVYSHLIVSLALISEKLRSLHFKSMNNT